MKVVPSKMSTKGWKNDEIIRSACWILVKVGSSTFLKSRYRSSIGFKISNAKFTSPKITVNKITQFVIIESNLENTPP